MKKEASFMKLDKDRIFYNKYANLSILCRNQLPLFA